MAKIIGNTTTTPMAIPDWNQKDEMKADYIKNKPALPDDIADLTATITELNYMKGTTDSVQDQLDAKTQVQIINDDALEILSILKIHQISQEQYEQKRVDGTLEDNAVYLTPDEEVDLSEYATVEQLNEKVDKEDGKVLSTNDYTNEDKQKLNDIANQVNNLNIPSLDGYATEYYVQQEVAAMIDSAPETLNTLNELADALGDDPNFATTVATEIGKKVDKVDGKGLSTNDYTNEDKAQLVSIAEALENLNIPSIEGLVSKTYVDTAVAQKTQVQIFTWEDDD